MMQPVLAFHSFCVFFTLAVSSTACLSIRQHLRQQGVGEGG